MVFITRVSLAVFLALHSVLVGVSGRHWLQASISRTVGFSEQSFCLCPMNPMTSVTCQVFLIHLLLENPALMCGLAKENELFQPHRGLQFMPLLLVWLFLLTCFSLEIFYCFFLNIKQI